MLNIYKNKGISLIELMVAVGLGLILILSMLAFYSISSQNVIDFQQANSDQQQIRKMLNLLETDIENIGGFECEDGRKKVFTAGLDSAEKRFPINIISLGNNPQRKQIVFVHPVINEYQHTALGMLDFDNNSKLKSYTPKLIEEISCGQARSSIYAGSTILEMIPMDGIIYTDTQYSDSQKANNIWAFVALSAAQSRRNGTQNIPVSTYTPNMNNATVMFLSDEGNNDNMPFGKNTVDIFLGFSPEGKNQMHVPNSEITNNEELKTGGWINPFKPQTNNYDLLVDTTKNTTLLSQTIHTDDIGKLINTSPLKEDLIKQVRAIKFQFTFGSHGDIPERKLTRVIRFKNTHLNQD